VTGDRHVLVGAYVLDALDVGERGEFEAHLRRCPDCVRETRELREAALKLAQAVRANAPRWLRDSVLARVSRTRQARGRWWRR
jgi:anti-sigma factor RsiW